MKILIVPAVDWFTALENRVHHLARVWRRDHQLHVVHFPLGGESLRKNEGDKIHRLYNARSRSLLAYYLLNFVPQMVQILRIIKREGIDLVVTTGLSAGTAAIVVSKISGTSSIFDYCDYLPAFSRYAGATGLMEALLGRVGELLTVFNLRVSDASVAIGEKLRLHSSDYSHLPYEIPNGVDGSRFGEIDRWCPGEELVLGYVGVLEFFAGLRSAIESLRHFESSRLLIVGDGRGRGELLKCAESLGLEGRVDFVGKVPYDEIGDWIGRMDFCVLPFESSDLTEAALPLKIHEYAACKRPIVTSPLYEVVRMYGDLLAYARGPEEISLRLRELLDDRKATIRRIHRAYLRATATYNWDRFGVRYEKVFLRVEGDTKGER